jgi:hypothetical protein
MTKTELPDLDVMMNLADIISEGKVELALCQAELESLLAIITRAVTEDRSYWSGNKPPTSTFIRTTYHVLGRNDEEGAKINDLRTRCAEIEARVSNAEYKFRTYRTMIDVWRTESANSRLSGY